VTSIIFRVVILKDKVHLENYSCLIITKHYLLTLVIGTMGGCELVDGKQKRERRGKYAMVNLP